MGRPPHGQPHAEVAEAEADALRGRRAEVSVSPVAVVGGQETTEGPSATTTTSDAPKPVQGFWQRLRRVWQKG